MPLLLWKAVLCYSHLQLLIPQQPGLPGADMQSGTAIPCSSPCVLWLLPVQGSWSSPAPTQLSETDSATLRWSWGFPPCSLHLLWLWPGPPPTPLPHCLGGAEPPSLLPCFIPRHVAGKQGSVAQREGDGTAGRAERQAAEPSLPPAAHRTTYLSAIGNQVTSTWK